MKTIADLFEIIGTAVSKNSRVCGTWFIDFSGHVNKISISYHLAGWTRGEQNIGETATFKMDEDGIQAAYWFIKTKL
jgi:hypothetical protein